MVTDSGDKMINVWTSVGEQLLELFDLGHLVVVFILPNFKVQTHAPSIPTIIILVYVIMHTVMSNSTVKHPYNPTVFFFSVELVDLRYLATANHVNKHLSVPSIHHLAPFKLFPSRYITQRQLIFYSTTPWVKA